MIWKLGSLFILILICTVMIAENETGERIDNLEDTLNWTKITNGTFEHRQDNVIVDIVYRFIDVIGYSTMEVAKLAVDAARENPDINYKGLMILVLVCLIAPILWPVFMIIIVSIIFVRDFWQNFKEKKEIKKLRRIKNEQNK